MLVKKTLAFALNGKTYERSYWVAGTSDPNFPVLLAVHGAWQSADPNTWIDYLNFPKMSALHNYLPHGWTIVYPDSGDKYWAGDEDQEFMARLYEEVLKKHNKIFYAGFSMGTLPIGDLLASGYKIDKAILHSGWYPLGAHKDLPVMGVSTETEKIPFLSRLLFNIPAWLLHWQFKQAMRLYNVVPACSKSPYLVPKLGHEWWEDNNPNFYSWLAE